MTKSISISILNSEDISSFFNELNDVKKEMNLIKNTEENFDINIHFDVMDSKFVNNIGIDLKYLKMAKYRGLYADTHLMVQNPLFDKYIEKAIEYGTDELTIHYEIENFEETLKYLNVRKNEILKEEGRDLIIGVAIKPETKVEELVKYKSFFSKLLIMTVEPGYGGQEYIRSVNDKIKIARSLLDSHIIQIDGGVNMKTIEEPLRLGVDSFVMGTYLVKLDCKKLYNKLISLNIKKDIEELPKDVDMEFEKRTLQIVPNGYAQDDKLLGINVPNIRKIANKWYKYVNEEILDDYITSAYHEYRRFALFCLSNMVKGNFKDIASVNYYIENKIQYINNWDLTDEVAPNITAKYLKCLESDKLRKEKLKEYIYSDNIWKKRIGIVSQLIFAKDGDEKLVLWVLDKVLYEEYHLFQKASGWVLRELYKKKSDIVLNYLREKNKNKRLPRILLSYACEKMTKEEKYVIKSLDDKK